jgi:hypothetical protein
LHPSVTWQMASIAVAFPIYMFVMRLILRETNDIERLQSGVRKWLTYIALFLTATAMICDLIAFLNTFLLGELSSRFVLKVATVLVIAAGIFAWYFVFLSWKRDSDRKDRTIPSRAFAFAATASVIATFFTGFSVIGSPTNQRHIQADVKRVEDLRQIANAIENWHRQATLNGSMASLPQNIEVLRARHILIGEGKDPETGASYEYSVLAGARYQLCANFNQATAAENPTRRFVSPFWHHPEGRACFVFDAAQPVPF